jgi:20S proteasome alpha/beta subunit
MTLIIGIRCSDGIVIGSDQKILRGGEAEYSNKIFVIDNAVALAIEGLTGIRDDFLYLLRIELDRRRGVDTLYEMKVIAEDIVATLAERYRERIKEESPIGVLMAGRERLITGKAIMYYIHGVGYGEQVEFLCTGHGGPYATTFAKFLLKKDLDCVENAKRIAFIISWVAEDVDVTVGGDPNVAIIRDWEKPQPPSEKEPVIEYLDPKTISEIKSYAKRVKAELPNILFFTRTNSNRTAS